MTYHLIKGDETYVSYNRNHRGNVDSIGNDEIEWAGDNLYSISGISLAHKFYFYYDSNGSLKVSCKDFSLKTSSDRHCFYRITNNDYVYNGEPVSLVNVKGIASAVLYNKVSYPIVTDHLGSVRAMFSPDGKEVIWERFYSAWGIKSVSYTDNLKYKALARKLEKLTIWSYAGLIELPFKGINDYYWSLTRVYSPKIKQWLSVDPLVKWSPKRLVAAPGNWYSVRYSANDPLNFVDPSGNLVVVDDAAIVLVAAGTAAVTTIASNPEMRKQFSDGIQALGNAVTDIGNWFSDKLVNIFAEGKPDDIVEAEVSSLEDLKQNQPNHPDFKTKRNWDRKKVKTPSGKGSGWPDKKGNVWEPTDHKGTHRPHWDVQHPDGSHTNVYPQFK